MSDSRASTRWRWLAVPVCALALYVIVRAANTPQGDTPSTGASASTSAPRNGSAPRTGSAQSTGSAPSTRSAPQSTSATPSVPAPASSYDPADYAPQVRTRAQQTGVSAQLLMAILYNESYKPHDPSFERAWQKYKPDAAFGIANMHRATFDEVRKGRDFAGRRWDELPDDRDLAIDAEAWYLHDLAAQLPATWSASYSKNELLALGYNTGAGNMLAFARGATPGSQAQSYLDKLHANWTKAGSAVGAG